MKFFTLASLAAGLPLGSAYFILTQNILETTRLDPILSPGAVSGHVHSIAGGSNFNSAMTYDSMRQGTCTTAPISVDLSNYWAPQLYYYDPTQAAFTMIPTAYMNAYYLVRPGASGIVNAFPDGLRMLSGDSTRRTFNSTDPNDLAISFVCLDYSTDHTGDPEWDQRNNFFTHNCPDGLRAQVNFPNCWDGVNIDSSDHKSHMAWPSGGVNGGDCPDSHPVHLLSLFYEFIFAVQDFPFNNESVPTWVLANGDSTGYGFHGDFINGWPSLINGTNILQEALDQCNADSGVGGELANCPPLAPYINNVASGCVPENPLVNENIGTNGYITTLPGNNPLWFNGSTVASIVKSTTPSFYNPDSVLPTGWSDVGCIAEATNGRALTSTYWTSTNLTRSVCVEYCDGLGYPLAGVESGNQCFCGYEMSNGASNTTLLTDGSCDNKCANNTYETCGGSWKLELFMNPSLFPAALDLPTGWESTGCMTEGTTSRALTGYTFSSSSMTPLLCIQTCASKGFSIAGVEYSEQCYCGNEYETGSIVATISECNMACSGAPYYTCGGPDRLTTFNNTIPTVIPPVVLPNGWSTFGCVHEPSNTRALSAYSFSSNLMTTDMCIETCQSLGYFYAGTEYSDECYCGDVISNGYSNLTISSCTMNCAGNSSLTCGGPSMLNVYVSINSTLPEMTEADLPTNWTSLGCYSEPSGGRALDGYSFSSDSMTTELCINTCNSRGYIYAGTEYSTQCFCDNILSPGSTVQTASTCTMSCSGASSTICGGSYLLNIYQSNQTVSQATDNSALIPSGWSALGCYTDSSSRTLDGKSYSDSSMTWESCTSFCYSNGYSYAGIEYGTQCYCDNIIASTGAIAPNSDCNMDCGGDSTYICGGSWAMTMFQSTTPPIVKPVPASPPAGWNPLGCFVDQGNSRTLDGSEYYDGLMTWESCTAFCSKNGYTYAGVEYSTQCYCGNGIDQTLAAASTDCNMDCGGDNTGLCGGSWRITVFESTSVSSSVNTVTSATTSTITVATTTATTATAATTTATTATTNTTTFTTPTNATTTTTTIASTTTTTAANTITSAGIYPKPTGYIHCFVDTNPYILNGTSTATSTNTDESCISTCATQGYAFAGTEYSSQCFCGNYLNLNVMANESECDYQCDGDGQEECGASWRVSVWGTGVGEGVVYGQIPGILGRRSRRRG